MIYTWTPCDFDITTNSEIRDKFAADSKIGCSALNCIEVDPVKESFHAFNKLISLFCVVSENTPPIADVIESAEQLSDQLSQTVFALTSLSDFLQTSLYNEELLHTRIGIYVDAAIKIHNRLPAEGNPIVEIL